MKVASHGATAIAAIAVCAYLAIAGLRPPTAAGLDAPATDFSAARAALDVAAIAQRPHPISSRDHDRVRDYVVSRFRALGVEPELQKTTGVFARAAVAGHVTNILARLRGTKSTRAVMLAAHYDSVPAGPGAGDDAAGVAVLLETLRALRAGAPLDNDVIFVVTDGEEAGLLGAAGFVQHPWAKDVGLVLNFDARGNDGPALMFETTPGNGRLIDLLADNAPQAFGSSLTYAVYQHMPNDTDLTIFRMAGLTGLNFAFIGNLEAYHTRLDTSRNLNPGTLQHQGSYAVGLARAAGTIDLSKPALTGANAVYFNAFGSHLSRYPESWAVPLAALAALQLLVVIVLAFRVRQLTWGTFGLALLAPPLSIAAASALGMLAVAAARSAHESWLPAGSVGLSDWYTSALLALAAAIAATWVFAIHRRNSGVALTVGGLIWWASLAVGTAVALPGASYLALWPVVFVSLSVGVAVLTVGSGQPSAATRLTSLALLLPAVWLLAPLVQLLHVVFPLNSAGAIILTGIVSIALWLVIVPLHQIVAAWGWRAPAGAWAIALALFVCGAMFTRYSEAHPQASNLLYLLDTDRHRAVWASDDAALNAWTAAVLTRSPDYGPLPAFYASKSARVAHHDAPLAALPAPVITVVGDTSGGSRRQLRLHVSANTPAWALRVRVLGAPVTAASVNGKPAVAQADESRATVEEWSLQFFNPGTDGIELTLELAPGKRFTLRATSYLLGLPALATGSAPPRPQDVMPNHEGDLTLITHAVQFEAAPSG